jgi:hypothetical protein
VVEPNGFSGHADHHGPLDLLGPAAGATGKVRLAHGEPEQAEAPAEALRRHGFADVGAPRRGETAPVAGAAQRSSPRAAFAGGAFSPPFQKS